MISALQKQIEGKIAEAIDSGVAGGSGYADKKKRFGFGNDAKLTSQRASWCL